MITFVIAMVTHFVVHLQAEEDLEHALLQWGDFETKFDSCSHWLKDMEQQVKNHELKSTLPEKKTQVEKFKVCMDYHLH